MLENRIVSKRKGMTPLMLRYSAVLIGIATICAPVSAIERRHGVVVGAITDISSATRTVAVKTADGAEHTFVFSEHTTVHGAKEVGQEPRTRSRDWKTAPKSLCTTQPTAARKRRTKWTTSETTA
jgi:hypothetical protein